MSLLLGRKSALLYFMRLIGVGVLSVIISCSFRTEKQKENGNIKTKVKSNFSSLYDNVFEPKCLECHEKPTHKNHRIVLSSYDKIVNSGVWPPLIVKGVPAESSLYKSVNGSGKMPKDRSRLHAHEIQMIYDWIKKGAPEFKKPVECDDPKATGCQEPPPPGECDDPEEPGCEPPPSECDDPNDPECE